MPYASTHDENRKKVCAPCGKKIKCLQGQSVSQYILTDIQNQLIKKYLCADFDISNPRYPQSLCCTCRLTLYEHEAENAKKKLFMS